MICLSDFITRILGTPAWLTPFRQELHELNTVRIYYSDFSLAQPN